MLLKRKSINLLICETTADSLELDDSEIKELQKSAINSKKASVFKKAKKEELEF